VRNIHKIHDFFISSGDGKLLFIPFIYSTISNKDGSYFTFTVRYYHNSELFRNGFFSEKEFKKLLEDNVIKPIELDYFYGDKITKPKLMVNFFFRKHIFI
jgi:deferrochelatase/peroxidase EfeB